MNKRFTHIGVFKTTTDSRVVLREEGKFWVAPNGISYEKNTPILDVKPTRERSMIGRERIQE